MHDTSSLLPLLSFIPFLIFPLIWLFMMVIMVSGMVLWVFMLVHAATHDIKDKTAWVVVLALTTFIGAAIYYLAVKRPYDAEHPYLQRPV